MKKKLIQTSNLDKYLYIHLGDQRKPQLMNPKSTINEKLYNLIDHDDYKTTLHKSQVTGLIEIGDQTMAKIATKQWRKGTQWSRREFAKI